MEAAYVLINLFFPVEQNQAHVKKFVEFLKEQETTKALNKDHWTTFYQFIHSVSEDLSDYDPEDAWPSLFDEYVDWKKKRNSTPEGAGEGSTSARKSYGINQKPVLKWGSENADYNQWY